MAVGGPWRYGLTIVTRTHDGHAIEFREPDGYMNLTGLCRSYGKKPHAFLRLPSIMQMQIDLAEDLGQLCESLIIGTVGRYGGTWIHPDLAVEACRWINGKFGLWGDPVIKSIGDGMRVVRELRLVRAIEEGHL